MSSLFVSSCIDATADQAARVDRKTWHRRRAQQLIQQFSGKRNILVTTHEHPDPDALAASIGLSYLLSQLLPDATITTSFKGRLGGGLNRIFAEYSLPHYEPWDEVHLESFDAICLLDCQPSFSNCPLPPELCPAAVIDHHPTLRGKRCRSLFSDIRHNTGASSSIVFGYFMEKNVDIPKDIAALMVYGIESDLSGAAGQPGDLDNVALSTLTLIADARKLYRIRFVDLPQNYYIAYFIALRNATMYDHAMISHLDTIHSPEQPAVMADFLLRYDEAQWVLVTAVAADQLILSLRTTFESTLSAGALMSRLVHRLGEGGGHPTKAGGYIPLPNTEPATIQNLRDQIKRRLTRALGIRTLRPQWLIPRTYVMPTIQA